MIAATIASMHVAVMEDRDELAGFLASFEAVAELAPLASAFWMDDASWWPRDLEPMPEDLHERIWAAVQAEVNTNA